MARRVSRGKTTRGLRWPSNRNPAIFLGGAGGHPSRCAVSRSIIPISPSAQGVRAPGSGPEGTRSPLRRATSREGACSNRPRVSPERRAEATRRSPSRCRSPLRIRFSRTAWKTAACKADSQMETRLRSPRRLPFSTSRPRSTLRPREPKRCGPKALGKPSRAARRRRRAILSAPCGSPVKIAWKRLPARCPTRRRCR